MIIKYKNKEIRVSAKKLNEFQKFTGLMFKSRKTENLLFDFPNDTKTPIHSLFVFFKFLIVWLDRDNNVLEYKIVEPFALIVKPEKPFRRFIELPLNRENKEIIYFIVGKERFK